MGQTPYWQIIDDRIADIKRSRAIDAAFPTVAVADLMRPDGTITGQVTVELNPTTGYPIAGTARRIN